MKAKALTIDFLYFDGCPHQEEAYQRLLEILKEQEIVADVTRIEIKDDDEAVKHRFAGSPTIRIDGLDIDQLPEDRPFAKTCRVYLIDGRFTGVPSKRMMEKAIRAAGQRRRGLDSK